MNPRLIISFLLLIFIACNSASDANFKKIKEFFPESKSVKSKFHVKSNIIDSKEYDDEISEIIKVSENKIFYSVNYAELPLEIEITPTELTVLNDYELTPTEKYTRSTSLLFKKPEYETIKGRYTEFNNENSKEPSLDIAWDYPYRVYFTIENDCLVLHRDYSFKTDRCFSFWLSKKEGLVKIIINFGVYLEMTKIK